jgi:hypothetical protein
MLLVQANLSPRNHVLYNTQKKNIMIHFNVQEILLTVTNLLEILGHATPHQESDIMSYW